MIQPTKTKQLLTALFASLVMISGCNAETKKAEETTESVIEETSKKEVTKTTETVVKETTAKTEEKPEDKKDSGEKMSNPKIKLETSKGNMVIELDAEKAPLSAANFVEYVNDGFYDGLIFHRVIPNFMVQGGGMNPDMSQKANKAPIQNEANNGLKNDRGTLAMARTNDPHSATSQFFINLKDNDFLNHTSETPAGWGYTVFGKVVEGLETIDEIAKVQTGNTGGHGDVPTEAITIIKATLEE